VKKYQPNPNNIDLEESIQLRAVKKEVMKTRFTRSSSGSSRPDRKRNFGNTILYRFLSHKEIKHAVFSKADLSKSILLKMTELKSTSIPSE
jgi:hypothetical protein